MSKKFKRDDRVILTGQYLIAGPEWPVWGSEYECVGTIIKPHIEPSYIEHKMYLVYWDNGESIISLEQNLQFFTGQAKRSLSPNIAFLQQKKDNNESRR